MTGRQSISLQTTPYKLFIQEDTMDFIDFQDKLYFQQRRENFSGYKSG